MGGERVDRGRGRAGRVVLVTLLVLLLAAAGVSTAFAYERGSLNSLICDGDCGIDAVIPPEGLAAVDRSGASPEAAVAGTPDLAAALAAGQTVLGDDLLGPHVGLAVASVDPDSPISATSEDAFVPASTTKLLTGLAALLTLDPQDRFATSVVRDGQTNRIVLEGGGDPYLTDAPPKKPDVRRASLAELADLTAVALKRDGLTSVELRYDDTIFVGDADNPAWERSYVAENIVTPISALWVDRGISGGVHSKTPAVDAANAFAELLRDRGITVADGTGQLSVPGEPLASVQSATVAQIVENFVRTSDNETAEVMARHVARASRQPASFAGGSAAIVEALRAAGVDVGTTQLFDGSGLSRGNRITPSTLVDVVRLAYSSGATAPVVDDLPVSGFSGTLSDRFDRATAGHVRAKTGTLSGIHSLAGVVTDSAGRPIVFAVMTDRADRTNAFLTQGKLDDVVEAIAKSG